MKLTPYLRQAQSLVQKLGDAQQWLAALHSSPETETLSVQLRQAQTRAALLMDAASAPFTLGLIGQSARGKQSLQQHLVSVDPQWQSTLSPLSRYRSAAVRLSAQLKRREDEVPLRLMSQACLVAMGAALSPLSLQDIDEGQLQSQLQDVKRRVQSDNVPGMDAQAVTALWQQCRLLGRTTPLLDRAFWPQAIVLAPYLHSDDRLRLFAVLWRDDARSLALCRQGFYCLEALSFATLVWLPLALFDGDDPLALSQRHTTAPVSLVPVINGQRTRARSITREELSLLAAELLIPQAAARHDHILPPLDVVQFPALGGHFDIPGVDEIAETRLQAKSRWLLARATASQQIDMLLIATAATHREQALHLGQSLWHWREETWPDAPPATGKPALLWCLSAFDQRVVEKANFDGAVQRAVGDHWGAMLVADPRDITRMLGWLQTLIDPVRRLTRLAARLHALRDDVRERLLLPLLTDGTTVTLARKQQIAERVLKTLQTRAGVHGELLENLMPSRERLRAWWQHTAQGETRHQPEVTDEETASDWGLHIDLFTPVATADSASVITLRQTAAEHAQAIERLWLTHLRTLPENLALLARLAITRAELAQLVLELMTAIRRLKLHVSLEQAIAQSQAEGGDRQRLIERQTQAVSSVMGDFIAWLGFQQIAESARPASRINQGHPIFTQPPRQSQHWETGKRLTRLERKPTNTTAFYIYDWLVALNTLIEHNAGFVAAPLNHGDQQQLSDIIAALG